MFQETLFPWRFPVEDGRDANDIIEEATKKKADRNVKLWQTAASTNDTSPAAISKMEGTETTALLAWLKSADLMIQKKYE